MHDPENLVTAEDFHKDFDRIVRHAGKGNGPVAITRDSQVIGVFMSPEEYDALRGAEIRKLLKSRERGPTVSHEDALRRSIASSSGVRRHDRTAAQDHSLASSRCE